MEHDDIPLLSIEQCKTMLEALVADSDLAEIGQNTYDLIPGSNSTTNAYATIHRKPAFGLHKKALGSVPVPCQEALITKWFELRLGRKLDEYTGIYDCLMHGNVFPFLIGRKPRSQFEEIGRRISPGTSFDASFAIFEQNIVLFLQRAANVLSPEYLFHLDELLYRRDIPKVIRSFIILAQVTDPENLATAMHVVPGSRMLWTQEDEFDEVWEENDFVKSCVPPRSSSGSQFEASIPSFASFCDHLKTSSKLSSFEIAVYGSIGSGKSATINTFFGRPCVPEHHNLSFINNVQTDRQKDIERMKEALFPLQLCEEGTPVGNQVLTSVVKCSGLVVRCIEIPSLENIRSSFLFSGQSHLVIAGQEEQVRKRLGSELGLHGIVLTERLDDLRFPDMFRTYQKLRQLYGIDVFRRLVVVLTHGNSVPPNGYTSEEFVEERIKLVRACIRCASLVPSPGFWFEYGFCQVRNAFLFVNPFRFWPHVTRMMKTLVQKIKRVDDRNEPASLEPPRASRHRFHKTQVRRQRWKNADEIIDSVPIVVLENNHLANGPEFPVFSDPAASRSELFAALLKIARIPDSQRYEVQESEPENATHSLELELDCSRKTVVPLLRVLGSRVPWFKPWLMTLAIVWLLHHV